MYQERQPCFLNADDSSGLINGERALSISLDIRERVRHLGNQKVEEDHFHKEEKDQVCRHPKPP